MTSTRITGGSGFRARRIALAALAALAAVVGVVRALGLPHAAARDRPVGADAASEVVSTEIIGIRTFTPPVGLDVAGGPRVRHPRGRHPAHARRVQPGPRRARRPSVPAVVSIHGGSWARGDKANADWRNVCMWLASEGFVAASVNYRLVPDARFPAAIDDVALAVEWLRAPEQVRALRRRSRAHRRVRRLGRRQPRVAARHHRARVRSTRARASRPSPSSRRRSGSGAAELVADGGLALAPRHRRRVPRLRARRRHRRLPAAGGCLAGHPGRPERPPVLHRPLPSRRSCRVGQSAAVRRDPRRGGRARRAGDRAGHASTPSASSTRRSARASPRSSTRISADGASNP